MQGGTEAWGSWGFRFGARPLYGAGSPKNASALLLRLQETSDAQRESQRHCSDHRL